MTWCRRLALGLPIAPSRRWPGATKGQATTEVVLLLPLFMFFLYAFAKIFAALILIQKMEIASYYAARRWQLESHRNVAYEGFDSGALRSDILKYVNAYLGVGSVISGPLYQTTTAKFLGITGSAQLRITRTQVWQVVTLTVFTQPIKTPLFKFRDLPFVVTKYVPNRDRPIAFVLPGLKQ